MLLNHRVLGLVTDVCYHTCDYIDNSGDINITVQTSLTFKNMSEFTIGKTHKRHQIVPRN